MSGNGAILFLDRDGTLNEEPPDEQVDSLEKIRLHARRRAGAAGTEARRASPSSWSPTRTASARAALPQRAFDRAHRFILELFASQGIEFEAVFICPHFKREDCGCRKPKTGMVREFLRGPSDRPGRAAS